MCPGLKATPSQSSDAMSALSAHSRFFDHLVELVPAKYYLDTGAEEKVGGGSRGEASQALGSTRQLTAAAGRQPPPGLQPATASRCDPAHLRHDCTATIPLLYRRST